ncbi:MAG: MrcB family domain-containing protein [Flavobacteriaceae bacterium]
MNDINHFENVKSKFSNHNFKSYIETLRKLLLELKIDKADPRVAFTLNKNKLQFIIGRRYCFNLENTNNKEHYLVISKTPLSNDSGMFGGRKPQPYYSYINNLNFDVSKWKMIIQTMKNELINTQNSNHRQSTDSDFNDYVFSESQKESFFKNIFKFLKQANTKNLKFKEFTLNYKNTKTRASFGKGTPAKIPWIAFLRFNQTMSNGIYPVYLYFKDKGLLILTYGISETNPPNTSWDLKDPQTINDYFVKRFSEKPDRYGTSFVYRVYKVDNLPDPEVMDQDLNGIINEYHQIFDKNSTQTEQETSQTMNNSEFIQASTSAGLKFSEPLVKRFTASLMTKPFLILSGLSGSGKTKLAQAFSMWISESEDQYCIVPVGADWTNRDPILGYVNALDDEKYVYPENGALKLMQRANEDETRPYFLILDEMNLSHVERYFADFLSVMESKDKFRLHEGDKIEEPPKSLGWPDNLYVIGTVNIDETTYMFSPKVLDRANVIEFRVKEEDMEVFLTQNHKVDMIQLKHQGKNQAADFLARASEATSVDLDDKQQIVLMNFFRELSKLGAEFGYRTASEITRFLDRIAKLEDSTKITDDHLDYAIIQKLLPKLHGSRNKLVKVLEVLGKNCLETPETENKVFTKDISEEDIRFSLSYEKLARMHKNAIDNGFASFAEA